ncbi:MAG: histidine phosphatase family protein [Lentisphaerae bacterium]|nr:histidine phosphatase family protein [Lentisphaerota bacterium]
MKKFILLLFCVMIFSASARMICITRHGQVGNWEKADVNHKLGEQQLTPLGRKQAELLGTYLKEKINFQGTILASPILRTTETACIAGKILDKTVILDPGLQEVNPGALPSPRGMTPAEAEELFPGMTVPGKNFTYPWRVSNEPREISRERFIAAFDRIIREHPGDLLLVTHAGGVSDIAGKLKERGKLPGWGMAWNCSLFIFELNEKDEPVSFRYVVEYMTDEQLTSNKHRYKVPSAHR